MAASKFAGLASGFSWYSWMLTILDLDRRRQFGGGNGWTLWLLLQERDEPDGGNCFPPNPVFLLGDKGELLCAG